VVDDHTQGSKLTTGELLPSRSPAGLILFLLGVRLVLSRVRLVLGGLRLGLCRFFFARLLPPLFLYFGPRHSKVSSCPWRSWLWSSEMFARSWVAEPANSGRPRWPRLLSTIGIGANFHVAAPSVKRGRTRRLLRACLSVMRGSLLNGCAVSWHAGAKPEYSDGPKGETTYSRLHHSTEHPRGGTGPARMRTGERHAVSAVAAREGAFLRNSNGVGNLLLPQSRRHIPQTAGPFGGYPTSVCPPPDLI
jgi:hypothetical protein